MAFEFVKLEIDGTFRIKPKIFADERGYFTETYKRSDFERVGIKADFRQDNQSSSTKGVIRGLHFQREPYAQGKLVRVVKGMIFDVGVDLRKDSRTFCLEVPLDPPIILTSSDPSCPSLPITRTFISSPYPYICIFTYDKP